MNRQQLIEARAAMLRPESRFYAEDYAAIVRAVNRLTPAQLKQSAQRQRAIDKVTDREARRHCQL